MQLPNPPPLRPVLGVFAAAFFVLQLSANAKEPSPSPTSDKQVERIILAHSYHPNAETESAQRVLVYTAEDLQEQGANTPVEGLRQVPFFVGTTATENDSNGGDGSALINLYGLGANNVVTLINGRRSFGFSDINAISISTLARVEIFGGNVYGSDSTAGTVNFILLNGPGEKPYEGAELYTLYGNTTDADAHVRQVYLRGGVTGLDGKVSIAAAGEYYSRAGLFSRDREISRSGDRSKNPTGLGLGGSNTNSPTFGGRVTVNPGGSTLAGGGAPTGTLVLTNLSNNQITPFSYRRFEQTFDTLGTDPSRFNFRAFTPAIPAMEKAMYFVTGRYKIFGEGLQLYGDIMYSKVKQDNAQTGTPFTMATAANGRTEARASSFNPFGDNLAVVAYRLQNELGNRRSFFDKDYYRYVAGINGDFNFRDNGFISRFGYDSGFVYERLNYQRVDSGDARRPYLRSLIAPVGFTNAAFSIPVAGTGTFNPFIGVNAPITGTAPIYNNTNPLALNFQNGVAIGSGPTTTGYRLLSGRTVELPTWATRSFTSAIGWLTSKSTRTSSRIGGTAASM